MDIKELERLAEWYVNHIEELRDRYNRLLSPIQHNANQPNKLPLEEELNNLLSYLRSMSFEDLSLQQLGLLHRLGVDQYIGHQGAQHVESVVRTSDYDPATAVERLNKAISSINTTNTGLTQYADALDALGVRGEPALEDANAIIIRVGFQNGAAIDNVVEWKDSAKDWHDIIRGLALAADEAPEDTKILGATTGSIILVLMSTAAVTSLMALVAKHVASVAKQTLDIANEMEDLQQKKFLNNVIRKELEKQQQSAKEAALKDIIAQINERLPNLDGEKVTALEGSIKKLIDFNEKGGNVDFVAPEPDPDVEVLEGNEDEVSPLADVKALIREYQATRDQIKLLTDGTGGAS